LKARAKAINAFAGLVFPSSPHPVEICSGLNKVFDFQPTARSRVDYPYQGESTPAMLDENGKAQRRNVSYHPRNQIASFMPSIQIKFHTSNECKKLEGFSSVISTAKSAVHEAQ